MPASRFRAVCARVGARRRPWSAFTVGGAVTALLLSGCGGSGSSDKIGGVSTVASAAIVRSEVAVLPNDGSVTIGAVTDSSVTLSGAGVPALKPGAVIVSGAGQGMLRKVVSATTSGGQTVAQTTPATLEDVFQKADIKIAGQQLGLSDFAQVNLAPGVTVAEGDAPSAESRAKSGGRAISKAFTFTLPPVDLASGGGQVTANGTVTVTLALDADIQIDDAGVKYVMFQPTVTGDVKAVASSTYKTNYSKSFTYAQLVGTPITVQVGPVPVVFTPTCSLTLVASGSADVGLIVTSTAHVSAQTGAVYTRGTGWTTTLPTFNKDGSFTVGKNVYATVDANLTPAHVQIGLNLYGVATGSIQANYPTINFHLAHQDTAPAGLRFTETATYNASAGYDVSVLGYTLTSYNSGDFIHGSDKWADQFFPDNGNVNLGVQ